MVAGAIDAASYLYEGDYSTAAITLGASIIPGGKLGMKIVGGVKAASKTRVFWSGGDTARSAAEKWAKSNNGITLEQTLTGRVLDRLTTEKNFKYLAPLWDKASKRFARGSQGEVHVFHSSSRGVRLNSVWAKSEYPILKNNNNDILYHLSR